MIDNSPAKQAGLRKDDVLIALGGQPVTDLKAVVMLCRQTRPGSELTFRIKRGDKEMAPIAIPEDKTYRWRVEEEFVGAIRGQEPVRRTAFVDAVNYMEFTEAVHISNREGRRVYLPLA